MSPQLDPNGQPVTAGAITVRTPGFSGTIEDASPRRGRRAAGVGPGDIPSVVSDALGDSAVHQAAAALTVAGGAPAPGRARRAAAVTSKVQVEAPPPPPRHGQMVITTDGSGLVNWHFAAAPVKGTAAKRGAGKGRVYEISPPAGEAASGRRRLAGALVGQVLVKVVAFPLFEKGVGRVADFFAGKWEAKKRPYRLRWFLPGDYTQPGGKEVTPDDVQGMKGKRALLMVHGTFSQSHTGLGRILTATMAELMKMYEGRILAFDHFTVSATPQENVAELIKRLPDDTEIEFDIVCHSRGGLVSRVLAEDQASLSMGGRKVGVRKIVFVATPNAGTALADGKHLNDMVDRYTNLLTLFPAPGAIDTIEAVVSVVKQLAVGAFGGLDGISCMIPKGPFLKQLNVGQGVPSRYYAFAANYEPTSSKLTAQARDFLADKIFGADNDLIVPTDGVFDKNGYGAFPIADRMVFGSKTGIQHSSYFSSSDFDQQLRDWLAAP